MSGALRNYLKANNRRSGRKLFVYWMQCQQEGQGSLYKLPGPTVLYMYLSASVVSLV